MNELKVVGYDVFWYLTLQIGNNL